LAITEPNDEVDSICIKPPEAAVNSDENSRDEDSAKQLYLITMRLW